MAGLLARVVRTAEYTVRVTYQEPSQEDWDQIYRGLDSLADLVADLELDRRNTSYSSSQIDEYLEQRSYDR